MSLTKKQIKLWESESRERFQHAISMWNSYIGDELKSGEYVTAITCWYKKDGVRGWEYHYQRNSSRPQFSFLITEPDNTRYPCYHGQARFAAHKALMRNNETVLPFAVTFRFDRDGKCYEID